MTPPPFNRTNARVVSLAMEPANKNSEQKSIIISTKINCYLAEADFYCDYTGLSTLKRLRKPANHKNGGPSFVSKEPVAILWPH